MTDLIDIAITITTACIFSVVISLIVATVHHLYQSSHNSTAQWPDHWLVMIILSVLPFIYCILPINAQPIINFNINPLPLIHELHNNVLNTPSEQRMTHNIIGYDGLSLALILWLLIWSSISLYSVYRQLRGIHHLKKIIKHALVLDDASALAASHLEKLQNLHDKTGVEIRITQQKISPFVCQWVKKYLVIPQRLLMNLDAQQLDLIISHEMAHLKKHDAPLMLLVQMLSSVMWFNPLINKFIQHMNCAIEMRCDNHVLSHKPHLRRTYAQLVLKVLRESVTQTSNPKVTAFSNTKHRSISMRINNIMKASEQDVKSKYRKTTLYGQALVLACMTFITQSQLQAAPLTETTETFVHPVKEAKVTSRYGTKNKFHKFHKGIDLGAKKDTPIVAIANGTVRISTDQIENRKNYGKIIIIDHADGLHSVYSHLNSRTVQQGQKIKAGELIGYVGETGKATGPHLHLEIRKGDEHLNPSDYIDFN